MKFLIKILLVTSTLINLFNCAPPKPTHKVMADQIRNNIGQLSQRFLTIKSTCDFAVAMKFYGAKSKLKDSITTIDFTDGVMKRINDVPTYASQFQLSYNYFNNGINVDTSIFKGEAVFEKRGKGWKIISIK